MKPCTRLIPIVAAVILCGPLGAQTWVDSSITRVYQDRWTQLVWIEANGLTHQGRELLDALAHAADEGLEPSDYVTDELESLLDGDLSPGDAWRLDSLLTRTFFAYGWDVSAGRLLPATIDSSWTATNHNIDLVTLLERAIVHDDVGAALASLAPPQPDYRALRDAMKRAADTTRAQIALNMERWRWLPRSLGERYIVVNSAAFTLELIDHDAVALRMRAIVGRPDWPTPIVSARATHIVFRPRWTVPRSIAEREILPSVARDPNYLTRQGFQVSRDSLLVQEPGASNPLGGMKLVFQTPFSVFIHDTPARPLFSESWRAVSHGCVRVEHAAGLAAQLLPTWTADSIEHAMTTGSERWTRLPQPIAVHLVYWTAWVGADGKVVLGNDPYGWDDRLAQALEVRRANRIASR